MATQLMDGFIIGWSTQLSIFSPNIYTLVFSFLRLSIYSADVIILLFLLVLVPLKNNYALTEL